MRRSSRLGLLAVVAMLVLSACGGGDGGDSAAGGDSGGGGGETLSFVGTNELAFSEAPSTATAGSLTFELTAEGAVNHTVAIEGQNGDQPVVEAAGGETQTGTIDLPAGTYTYFCTIPGHRAAGMEGTLTVQ